MKYIINQFIYWAYEIPLLYFMITDIITKIVKVICLLFETNIVLSKKKKISYKDDFWII